MPHISLNYSRCIKFSCVYDVNARTLCPSRSKLVEFNVTVGKTCVILYVIEVQLQRNNCAILTEAKKTKIRKNKSNQKSKRKMDNNTLNLLIKQLITRHYNDYARYVDKYMHMYKSVL